MDDMCWGHLGVRGRSWGVEERPVYLPSTLIGHRLAANMPYSPANWQLHDERGALEHGSPGDSGVW